MKVIDANWDEKITGLKTCEIIFEKGDNFESYLSSGLEKNFRFIVTKIPINDLKLVHQLEDIGFRYLENQMKLSFEVNQLDKIDPSWERLLSGFICEKVTSDDEINEINAEVNSRMFEADRFSIDPFWAPEVSTHRYTNWIRELYKKWDTRIYTIAHNGSKAGFFAMHPESDKINSCPIAGIFNRYKGYGYIFALTWFWLDLSRKAGNARAITYISTNNRIILSSLSKAFAFRICETLIVMRKVLS
jgi:hypothetical protein